MNYRSTVIAVVALFAMMITAITVLLVFNKDPSTLVTFVGASVIPSILILINQAKTDEIGKKMDDVNDNVNGRMTQLINAKTTAEDTEE